MQMIQIGELSRLTGISTSTIRFYEDSGLISETARSPSNKRLYDDNALQRLFFVRNARSTGLSVENVLELLCALDGTEGSDAIANAIIDRNIDEAEARILMLRSLHDELTRVKGLPRTGPSADRVIRSMSLDTSNIRASR